MDNSTDRGDSLGTRGSPRRIQRLGSQRRDELYGVAARRHRLLTDTPQNTRVLIAVDDAHHLDDLSAFVVHQIMQRATAKLMLTVRDGELLSPAVQEIWTTGRFERIDVQSLTVDDTSALLTQVLGDPVDSDSIARLWTLTRGNMLYLRHIVDQEVSADRLHRDDGVWRWTGAPTVPPSLAELIETRIGRLPDSVSDVLDTLAVGEPMELAALERMTDPRAVEHAETRGLITVQPTDAGLTVQLAHPIYGEVRRRRAPATKLRRLRGLVADELAASDASQDIPVLVRRAALSLTPTGLWMVKP